MVERQLYNFQKRFLFEIAWFKEEECTNLVSGSWKETGMVDLAGVQAISESCTNKLRSWNRMSFKSIQQELDWRKKQLEKLQQRYPDKETLTRRIQIERDINQLLEKEETMWLQRSHISWMKEGDKNTKFFHSYANGRRRKNMITGILDADGAWETRKENISIILLEHFKNIYKAGDVQINNDLFFGMHGRVTEEMNRELLRPFTREDIETSLFGMHPSKSPGFDGLPAAFFQKY